MSSSARSGAAQKKPSRVERPVEDASLKKHKADERGEQGAQLGTLVDLYQVGRLHVLANTLQDEVEAAASDPPVIDLTSDPVPFGPDLRKKAGAWRGEHRPNGGLVLTRGRKEIL